MFENYNIARKYYLNSNTYDSILGSQATATGLTFTKTTITTPQATIDWLKYGGYILIGGEKIPNPQFSLPSGATQVSAKGYNYPINAVINFNPTNTDLITESAFKFFKASDTAIWDGSAAWLAEFDPLKPYLWNETMLNPDFIKSHVKIAWEGFVYELFNNENMTDIIGYISAMTNSQQNEKLAKWKPQYSNLL